MSESDVIPIGVSMLSHNRWPVPSTRSVPRRSDDMVRSVADLIDMSTSLILVDRNFNPADGRFSKVLAAFADYLLNIRIHQPKIQQIKFVTTYEQDHCNKTILQFEKRCREFLPSILPNGIEVRFHLKVKNLLHARFVLTNKGGVNFHFGLGFQLYPEVLTDLQKDVISYTPMVSPGSLHWKGYYNTNYMIDPKEGLVIMLYTNIYPNPRVWEKFLNTVYQTLQ